MSARNDYPTLDLLTRSHIFDGKHGAVDDALVEIDHLRAEVDRLNAELAESKSEAAYLYDKVCDSDDDQAASSNELARIRIDYEQQLATVADLTETLAEERVQHAAQVERIRCELAATAARIAAWDDALGAVVPELEREMAPEQPRLVGP